MVLRDPIADSIPTIEFLTETMYSLAFPQVGHSIIPWEDLMKSNAVESRIRWPDHDRAVKSTFGILRGYLHPKNDRRGSTSPKLLFILSRLNLMRLTLFFAFALCVSSVCSYADEFRLLAWNVESNRPNSAPVSDAGVIAKQLTELMSQPDTKSQLVALSEVDPKSFFGFRDAVAAGLHSEVDFVTSGSGGFQDSDSLMLIVDTSRFAIDQALELHRYAGVTANFNVVEKDSPDYGALRSRSPLAVRLLDKKSLKHFWVVVNHLARGEAELRTDQAKMLVKWAAALNEPAISAGDHNFDFDFKTQQGNDGYKAMIEGGVWQWLRPDPLIDSNWSDDRNVKDRRVDRYPDSILDFIWVANSAKNWKGDSDVVVREGDFPDNETTSDHRPLIARFEPSGS